MNEYLVSKFESLIIKIKEIFEQYDADKSGSLETMEIGMLLQSLGVEMTD
jgi:Ca2+-binding EF-hand superfamily protein